MSNVKSETVDLVLCEFDTVDDVPDKNELTLVAKLCYGRCIQAVISISM